MQAHFADQVGEADNGCAQMIGIGIHGSGLHNLPVGRWSGRPLHGPGMETS
jgi:hypothetical protein